MITTNQNQFQIGFSFYLLFEQKDLRPLSWVLPVVDKFVVEWVTRLAFHDVTLSLFVGEGDGGYEISSQIDTQDCDGSQGEGNVRQDEEQEGRNLRNVGCQGVSDGLLQVVEDQTSCKRWGIV